MERERGEQGETEKRRKEIEEHTINPDGPQSAGDSGILEAVWDEYQVQPQLLFFELPINE